MKTIYGQYSSVPLLLIIAMLFFSCSSDDSNSNSTNSVDSVVSIVKSGTWKITYYFDTDKEETSNFSGYNFTFANNGVLTASNGTLTQTGTWSITDSNSSDDSISDLDFNVGFSSPATFAELTDDWEIIEKTATVIKLKDVSGGNGGIDYLTFTKN
nr:hypothetical protein [uncultured Flavobacterium sp.]